MKSEVIQRPVGVGVIGAGWMGRLHANAYFDAIRKYPELGLEIRPVVVADVVPANADAIARKFGFRRTTDSYASVFSDPEVDVVSICAPNYLHKELALAAVEAGKAFWIEKPMGASHHESREIAEAVAAAGLITAVGFNYRHAPAVDYARTAILGGRLGRIHNLHVRFNADYSADPDSPRTWRFERSKAGSGVFGDLLSHGTDLAQYLVGQRIESVSALSETFVRTRPPTTGGGIGNYVSGDSSAERLPVENEDFAAMLVRFDQGVVGTLESSRIAVGARCEYGFEVYGEKGSLKWDFERMNELLICLRSEAGPYGFTRVMSDDRFGDFSRFQVGAGLGLSFDDLKTIEGAKFLDSVRTGTQLAPSVGDGYVSAAIVGSAERSSLTRAWESVPQPIGATTFVHPGQHSRVEE